MIQSRLITSQVIDSVKSRLDDYHLDGFLRDNFVTKVTSSPIRLIKALNEADIASCADLKPESQVIVYVPKGTNIIPLRASSTHKHKLELGMIESYSGSDPFALSVLLNEQYFVEARQIRSETLRAYREFPLSTKSGYTAYTLKSFNAFQEGKTRGDGNVAYVDYKRSIIQLSSNTADGTFFTFPAYLFPEKINYEELTDTQGKVDFKKYRICTPEYAEQLLVLATLKELIPETNKLFGVLRNRVMEETVRTVSRMPSNQETVSVKGYIGGGDEFSW